MHGGAVARDGRAMVLFGPNGSFKTQLVLDLCLRHGFEFLGDDLVMLRDGQALAFVEHPAVLAARAEAVEAGRTAKAGAWRLARHLFGNGESNWSRLRVAGAARVEAVVSLEREADGTGSHLENGAKPQARLEDCPASAVWKRARALDRFELVKHQRRYRQVVNFARFAMAYEYAFPGSRVFDLALGDAGLAPFEAESVRGALCRMSYRYDVRTSGLLAKFWDSGGGIR
jgi:hypothetical protein